MKNPLFKILHQKYSKFWYFLHDLKEIRAKISRSKNIASRGAALAQWIRLRLPHCRPGFKSQAHHLPFYQIIFKLLLVEKTKISKKRPGLATDQKTLHLYYLLRHVAWMKKSQSNLWIERFRSLASWPGGRMKSVFEPVLLWLRVASVVMPDGAADAGPTSWGGPTKLLPGWKWFEVNIASSISAKL